MVRTAQQHGRQSFTKLALFSTRATGARQGAAQVKQTATLAYARARLPGLDLSE